jgi:hypothetical protein
MHAQTQVFKALQHALSALARALQYSGRDQDQMRSKALRSDL